MADINILTRRRGTEKAKLTRFKTYLDAFHENTDDIHELQSRINSVKEVFCEFEKIQFDIEGIDNSDAQMIERDNFETAFHSSIGRANRIISMRQHNPIQNVNAQENQNPNEPTRKFAVKLPTMNLPTFDGSYEHWLNFYDSFTALVHNNTTLPDIQKLYYLRSSLKGIAAEIIDSLESSAQNYPVAWELLQKRFKNTKLITNHHIQALLDIPTIHKESGIALRSTIDNVQKHVRAIEILKANSWDVIMLHLIVAKLDAETRKNWKTETLDDENVTLKTLLTFLEKRASVLDNDYLHKTSSKSHGNTKPHASRKANSEISCISVANDKCPVCNASHRIYECATFRNLSVSARVSEAKKHKLCFNCLRSHKGQACALGGCRKCNKKHNTLLHDNDTSESTSSTTNQAENNRAEQKQLENTISQTHCVTKCQSEVLLSTAILHIRDSRGLMHECRALLDSASQSNFISRALCNKLQLHSERIDVPVSGLAQISTRVSERVHTIIKSRLNAYQVKLPYFVIDKITDSLPSTALHLLSFQIPDDIALADPTFDMPGKVELLLGASIFWELLCIGQIRFANNMPILQKTKFGWIVSGPISPKAQYSNSGQTASFCIFSPEIQIQRQLERFWITEECTKSKHLSSEEQACEDHFMHTTIREEDGRFNVKMPIKGNISQLGESRHAAAHRLRSMERKFIRSPKLKQQYVAFINEYISLGHCSEISAKDSNSFLHYLPHHAVMKESSNTTKLRVVFDGSNKTSSNVSINDILLVGPSIQPDLFSIALGFREHTYVISADIAKMYRQVNIHKDQRNLQVILWREDPKEAMRILRLNTVTYGLASSSYLAIRCLDQLARENAVTFPQASSIIQQNFYVDNMLCGADTIEELSIIKREVTQILGGAKFELRQWVSNEPSILLESDDISLESILPIGEEVKTLGLLWNPQEDALQYRVEDSDVPIRVSKRVILSTISQIFDPLGLVGPIVIKAKILLQQLWKIQVHWDESLPLDLHTAWIKYVQQLPQLSTISIPRHVMQACSGQIELHGFCDASEAAYGACLYIKHYQRGRKPTVRLLCAKSKVAPLKKVSLPRLELCGALLLSRLCKKVTDALTKKIDSTYLWCDSTITIAWISGQPHQWKTFVANRIAEIHELTNQAKWRHIESKHNPADIISRGLNPAELKQTELWWNGPTWLQQDVDDWPHAAAEEVTEIPDAKRPTTTFLVNIGELAIFDRYSSLSRLKRVVAYILRFKYNALNSKSRKCGSLDVDELENSMNVLLKCMQEREFSLEVHALKSNREICQNSRLYNLCVFLDANGLIRVGGRLRNANIPYSQKHGIVIPTKHKLTELIIKDEHYRTLHTGAQALLAHLRTRFWPLSGKTAVRRVLQKCIVCFRTRPMIKEQLMGDLPVERVTPSRAFERSGVDYAGAFRIKLSRNKTGKAYLCVFICMVTKAVHLELVSDLTTTAFLNSLKRFISRRGKPSDMFSDNGANFIGADNDLRELTNLLTNSDHNNKILDFTAQQSIRWHFIPPHSPHFGGLWESAVRSAKTHMKRVVGNALLNFEELYTVFTMIEACLNSRPLCPISDDPSDLSSLTPGHFLIGQSLINIPEPEVQEIAPNRLSRYEYLIQLKQHFWTRWSREYLTQLQQRVKWNKRNSNIVSPGTLVLLKDDNLPPLQWRMGRVVELHPGKDNLVRVVSIKTSNGIIKRSLAKICILPIEEGKN